MLCHVVLDDIFLYHINTISNIQGGSRCHCPRLLTWAAAMATPAAWARRRRGRTASADPEDDSTAWSLELRETVPFCFSRRMQFGKGCGMLRKVILKETEGFQN